MKTQKAVATVAGKPAEVLTKEQVAQEARLIELGKEIVVAAGDLAGKYLSLVLFIRANKVGPKIVAARLGELGFNRQRVSEINRVANTADDLFQQYQAKLIGFKGVLELARNVDKKGSQLTPAGSLLIEEGTLEEGDERAMLKGAEPTNKGGGPRAKKTARSLINEAAMTILTNITKEREWVDEKRGWKLLAVKIKVDAAK